MIQKIFVLAIIGMFGAPFAFAAEDKFPIAVMVKGAKPGTGQILISLFDSAQSYMKAPLLEANVDVDSDGKAVIVLHAQAPGEYAIIAIYDENGNGKLDTGIFRIPKEKIGYSNNARGNLGPAKWKDARFVVTDSGVNVSIQLAKAGRDR